MWRWLSGLLALTWLVGCNQPPPPNWAAGGSTLNVPVARWRGGLGEDVVLTRDGWVLVAGERAFQVDGQGRVRDDTGSPYAVLDEEGHLVGIHNVFLGRVGVHNSAPPWSAVAWLRVDSDGSVLLFGDEQTIEAGVWSGCKEAGLRTCTLVTHLMALDAVRAPRPAMRYGLGFGMWY